MKAIDRKLVRDLAQMKAQVVTIALVIACGVAALVAALATYHSLRRSQEAFYVESHFAVVGKLDRVRSQVHDDLAKAPWVTQQVSRHIGMEQTGQIQSF